MWSVCASLSPDHHHSSCSSSSSKSTLRRRQTALVVVVVVVSKKLKTVHALLFRPYLDVQMHSKRVAADRPNDGNKSLRSAKEQSRVTCFLCERERASEREENHSGLLQNYTHCELIHKSNENSGDNCTAFDGDDAGDDSHDHNDDADDADDPHDDDDDDNDERLATAAPHQPNTLFS